VSRNPLDALNAVGSGARSVVSRIEEALDHLEDLVDGVRAMERELIGMRRDVRALGKKVDGLRGDVQTMHTGVGGIRHATESLDRQFHEVPDRLASVDERIGRLAGSLEAVDALAMRLGRFGRRNRKARPQVEGEKSEAAMLDGQVLAGEPDPAPESPDLADLAGPDAPTPPDDRPEGR